MDIPNVKPFLEMFYGEADAYVVKDDPATTFSSCGVILLAAVLAETSSVAVLRKITGFPADFIKVVLHILESSGYHLSLQFADLISAAHLHKDDFKKVEDAVNNMMEYYWSRMNSVWCDALIVLRGGYLFGGRLQWWIDTEQELLAHENQWVQ